MATNSNKKDQGKTVKVTATKKNNSKTVKSTTTKKKVATSSKTVKAKKAVSLGKPATIDQLTDQDILKMSDDEYMNELQLMYFKIKLEQMKHEILSKADKTTESLRQEAAVFPDDSDRATVEEEHALELRKRDRERKLLKKIEQSIQRINSGEYGYCEETGEPIGIGRLLARPTASLSIEAQQRRELKQKMFGD